MFIGLLSACTIGSFGESLSSNSRWPIKCVSLDNQPCQVTSTFIDINSNKTLLYIYTVSINKCGGSCNTINDPYARVCVPSKVKNMILKVCPLITGVSEAKHLAQHESCQCKRGLNQSVCNSLQKWNHLKCWCDFKEVNGWGFCIHYYTWSPLYVELRM